MSEYLSYPDIKQELLARKEVLQRGSPTVIKIGGSIAAEADTTLRDVAFLHREIGTPLVIVHGGGPEIDRALREGGVETRRIEGLRVTDSKTLAVVVSVLDSINAQMIGALQNFGVNAIGYDSQSGLLQAVVEDPRLGFVGSASMVDAERLRSHVDQGIVPVITPIAIMQGNSTQFININGDTTAGAIAASLGSHLILATDVPGVKDANDLIMSDIDSDQYSQMYAAGIITSGMIPKIQAGLQAASAGGRAIICRGQDLLYAFGEKPRGTYVH